MSKPLDVQDAVSHVSQLTKHPVILLCDNVKMRRGRTCQVCANCVSGTITCGVSSVLGAHTDWLQYNSAALSRRAGSGCMSAGKVTLC